MNQNFSKSEILHQSSKLEHFQGGGGLKNFGGANLGGGLKISDLSSQVSNIIFPIFWTEGKNSLDYLEKKYGNIG